MNAVLEALIKFRCYIEIQDFEVITDHCSIVWLREQSNLKGRLALWAMKLQHYKFPVRQRKGRDHVVPNALSRIPESDIAEIVDAGPEVNLESAHFSDEDYQLLKNQIRSKQNYLPDLKVVDEFVYARREHALGKTEQEQESPKSYGFLNSYVQN